MSKLLVDTSFIIPFFRVDDSLRENALINKELLEEDCYISNLIINEVLTILAMRTKNMELVKQAYDFLINRFSVIDEYSLVNFNDRVFNVFFNVNSDGYNLSFVDSSLVVLCNLFDLKLVTFDDGFKRVDGLNIENLKK